MTAAGALVITRRDDVDAQRVDLVDYLADLFSNLEKKASAAYDNAYRLDVPVEALKERLIHLVLESGNQENGSCTLRGREYELALTFAPSFQNDYEAVTHFRYALIGERRLKGRMPDIFEGRMTYSLRPEGKEILSRAKLSDRLMSLYRQCRVESRMPILDVRPLG